MNDKQARARSEAQHSQIMIPFDLTCDVSGSMCPAISVCTGVARHAGGAHGLAAR
jgi:hypothetical protein